MRSEFIPNVNPHLIEENSSGIDQYKNCKNYQQADYPVKICIRPSYWGGKYSCHESRVEKIYSETGFSNFVDK